MALALVVAGAGRRGRWSARSLVLVGAVAGRRGRWCWSALVGRVLRATGGGSDRKLEIDFGGGGVRTILARFVTELPPEA